jgi:hypothetical protein
LASPVGVTIKFRYEDEYVVADVDRDVESGQIIGSEALLVFVADVDSGSQDPFVVPVRYAQVVSATRHGNMFVFNLRLCEYVDLDQYPRDHDSIRRLSRDFIIGLKSSNKRYFPAIYSAPDLHIRRSKKLPDEAWQHAAIRLASHPTFKDTYFLRVDAPVTQRGGELPLDEDGRLQVVDQRTIKISTRFYSEKYDSQLKPLLACSTDGTFLRISSASEFEISHRYDSFEFWIHPTALSYETLSLLTVSLSDSTPGSPILPTYVRFPVTVRRLSSQLIARLLTTSAGALLVALPAILGSGTPIMVRILSAVLGAILLAIASIILTNPR